MLYSNIEQLNRKTRISAKGMLQYLYNATDANEIYVTGYIYTNTVGTIKNLPNNDRGLLIVFALDEVKYWVFQIAITFNEGNPKMHFRLHTSHWYEWINV